MRSPTFASLFTYAAITIAVEGCTTEFSPAAELETAPNVPTACSVRGAVNGPISFRPPFDVGNGFGGVTAVDAGDIDGDGYADLALMRSNRVSWFEAPAGTGSWTSHTLPRPSVSRPFLGAGKVADMDGDGDLDMVVSLDQHTSSSPSAYVYIYENPGSTTVRSGSAWQVREIVGNLAVNHINDMVLADMDADGKRDVVFRSLDPNRLYIFFQNSLTSWSSRFIDSSTYGARGEGFAVGDIDRDGRLDITICGHWLRGPPLARSGQFTSYSIDAGYSNVNANVKEAVGDINGDGRVDVILSPAEGYRGGRNHVLAWYEAPSNPLTSNAWTQHVLVSNTNGGHTVLLADMDADGDLDVVHGIAWSMWGQSASTKIYFNLGSRGFSSGQIVSSGNGLYSGVVLDVGGDGDLDIVGQRTYGGVNPTYLYESLESTGSTATCSDGVRNQGETGVDCGGPCPPCPPRCGNGVVEAGEECDDGNTDDLDSCSNQCISATCIDGVQNQGESGIDCGGPCSPCPPRCGNGVVETGEECDDGNADNLDRCSNQCVASTCSDGVRNQGEQAVDCGGPCAPCVTPARCGDGNVDPGEECDDGNQEDLDSCSNRCIAATCTDGVRNQGETAIDCGGPCRPCPQPGSPLPVMDGLAMWLTGDRGLNVDTDGGVASWDDQSGVGRRLLRISGRPQSVSGQLNGKAVVSFDGSSDALGAATSAGLPSGGEDRTVVFVVRYRSPGFGGFSWGTASCNRMFGPAVLSSEAALSVQGWCSENDFKSAFRADNAGWIIQTVLYQSGRLVHAMNSTVVDQRDHRFDTDPAGWIRVGVEHNDDRNVAMDVAEVIVYDRALSSEELATLENYLESLYSIDAPEPPTRCTTDADCDDDLACTEDRCQDSGLCLHVPDDGACSDGLFCNGREICDPVQTRCVSGAPVECDDGSVCTTDRCDEASRQCLHIPR